MRLLTSTTILPLVMLSACGSPAPENGDFAAACNANGNLDPALCACLDDQTGNLSPDAHRFVIATIAEDEAEAQRLRGDLDEGEATQAAQFISRGIQACRIEVPTTEDADMIESAPDAMPGEATPPEGDEAMAGETAMGETGNGNAAPVEE